MPQIYKNTFVYLISFFLKVVEHHEVNKMPLHNLATVITPNIFRPFDLTPNDLIYAGQLVEVFKIMMQNHCYIFNVSNE